MKRFILIRAVKFFYFNFLKKIFFIDYLFNTLTRNMSIFINNGISIIVKGDFDETNLVNDYFFRINWYLKPIEKKIKEIYFPKSFEKATKTIPNYLNQNITNHLFDNQKIYYGKNFKKYFFHNKFNYIVLNCTGTQKNMLSKHEILFNSREESRGALNSLKIGEENFNSKVLIKNSHRKFLEINKNDKPNSVLLIGSGPNVKKLNTENLDKFDVMVCNSIIKDQKFLENYPPDYVVFGDPSFHSGPSNYVEEFQKSLIQTIEKFNSTVITVKRDAHIINEYIPKKYHKNFIFIPYVKSDQKTKQNYNLKNNFYVAGTNNILTLLMLPVAFCLYKNIYFAGFDGNPNREKNYYWKHNNSFQFTSKMSSIETTHPFIFNKKHIDYNWYSEIHSNNLFEWFNENNLNNHNLFNLTKSHLQPLQNLYKEFS